MDKKLMTTHSPQFDVLMDFLGLKERHVTAFTMDVSHDQLPTLSVKHYVREPQNEQDLKIVKEDFILILKSELEQIRAPAVPVLEHVVANPIATLHVDGSYVHTEWHVTRPHECHIPVYAVPPGNFKRIDQHPPPRKKPLEVVRHSGYTTTKYEVLTAQFDPDYKGWVDPGNTRLRDSGDDPLWWRELPDLSTLP